MSDQPFSFAAASNMHANELVSACIEQLGSLAADINIGFVYATDILADDFPAIIKQLQQQTGVTNWVGTIGTGICAGDQELYDHPALCILAGAFPEDSFRFYRLDDNGLLDFTAENADWLKNNLHHLAIMHGDPRTQSISEQIPDFVSTVPRSFLVGGLTSSQSDSYPQYANGIHEHGVSGVVFNQQVQVATTLSQGCTPIGPLHSVSKARQNVIMTLDSKPALDVLKEDIGEILARNLDRVGGYIFIGLPVTGSDTGDFLVRNLIGLDPANKHVVIGDWVEDGQKLLFCRRDGASARTDLRQHLAGLKQRIGKQHIRGGLYYSCLGRGRYLFGEESQELKLIHEILGEFPLCGFFANGEIANNQLYGYTGVLTLFL